MSKHEDTLTVLPVVLKDLNDSFLKQSTTTKVWGQILAGSIAALTVVFAGIEALRH